MKIHALVITTALIAPASAFAAPVERRMHSNSLEASSFLWNDWNKFQENYHPNYVADDDPKTAWVEGSAGSGAGEWLRINLTPLDKTTVVRLRIRNGYQKSKPLFAANARVKELTVRLLPGKTELAATLTDKDGWQELSITQPAGPLRAVELAVKSVYEGSKYTDLCISDVQVFATSETPDNPAFEKSKHKDLLAWRAARIAAAKMFARRKVDLPLYTAYKITSTEIQFPGDYASESSELVGMIKAATDDPGFKEWKPVLATALAVAGDVDKLPRSQIAPTSKQALPEVDGFVHADLSETEDEYFNADALRLPMIASVSVMFADQLRVLDVKDKLTVADFSNTERKCKGDVTWVKREPMKAIGTATSEVKAVPDVVQAIVVGRCGKVEGREGSYNMTATELLVYDGDGRLALVIGAGHLDAYRWAVDGGKPMIAGGRALLQQGSVVDSTKQQ